MNRKIILVRRPFGVPEKEDFQLVEEPISQVLKRGEVLVRVEWLSIDPAIRVWISGARSYLDPVAIGSLVKGIGVGIVVNSRSPAFKVNNYVSGFLGWQEFAKVNAKELTKLPSYENPQLYLGVLGITGLTAYFVITDLAKPSRRDTVLVSTAGGAVGSIACQLAKMKGCYVVGITGSHEKASWLLENQAVDTVINYKTEIDLEKAISESCPKGVDIFIDNVGDKLLDQVLLNINRHARIVLCGAISSYNLRRAQGIRNYP